MEEKERTGMPLVSLGEDELADVTGGAGTSGVWMKRLLDSSLPIGVKQLLIAVVAKRGYSAARARARELISEYPEWADILR